MRESAELQSLRTRLQRQRAVLNNIEEQLAIYPKGDQPIRLLVQREETQSEIQRLTKLIKIEIERLAALSEATSEEDSEWVRFWKFLQIVLGLALGGLAGIAGFRVLQWTGLALGGLAVGILVAAVVLTKPMLKVLKVTKAFATSLIAGYVTAVGNVLVIEFIWPPMEPTPGEPYSTVANKLTALEISLIVEYSIVAGIVLIIEFIRPLTETSTEGPY